ncbi:hypothetical protein FO519_006422 [Halicephalobus sp. NKZ332]|nr:hypothetical protein FO519_006422 [Halicephalobus sp. NKZ332]
MHSNFMGISATQCFLPTYHRGVSNAAPIAELWNVSPFDCLTYCIVNAGKTGDGCASIVYHRHFSTCQLYSHDGTYNGAKVVFANGHDYYNRTSFSGICQDRHPPARGYPQRRNGKPRALGLPQQTTPLKQVVQDRLSHDNFAPHGSHKSYYLYPNQPKTGCSRNQKIGYLALNDFTLTPTTPIGKVNGVDKFGCLNYCIQNIDAHGDPAFCTLISYNSATEECQLHDDTAKEAGLFTRVEPRKYSTVAEKFCLDKNVRCPEEKIFEVILGKEIHDSALHVFTNFETLSECIDACFEHPICRAVSMKNGNCSLFATNVEVEADLLHDSGNTIVVDCKC